VPDSPSVRSALPPSRDLRPPFFHLRREISVVSPHSIFRPFCWSNSLDCLYVHRNPSLLHAAPFPHHSHVDFRPASFFRTPSSMNPFWQLEVFFSFFTSTLRYFSPGLQLGILPRTRCRRFCVLTRHLPAKCQPIRFNQTVRFSVQPPDRHLLFLGQALNTGLSFVLRSRFGLPPSLDETLCTIEYYF